MKFEDVLSVLLLPIAIWVLNFYLIAELFKGNSVNASLNDLVEDDCIDYNKRCYI